MTVLVELDLPKDWKSFQLPPALHERLQDLLDRQDRDGKLSRRAAPRSHGITELVDMLALMRLRSEPAEGDRNCTFQCDLSG